MELRDEFALAALNAIYADTLADWRIGERGPLDERWREGIALEAYKMADAMINMRAAKVTPNAELSGGGTPSA